MASKVDSSGLSVISEERSSARKNNDNGDDHESVYSNHKSKSVYGGGHKKKLHPLLLGPGRQNPGKIISLHSASKNNLSEFTQRIMSAKLLRTKQVQNQLNETQNQLNELINENRILRNLLKRQEGALKKYEGNHAELPQLIRSHNEEIRALKANNKIIKAQLRESNTKLKDRENELEALKDSYNKLKKLSTEKNLLEREKLQKKVEDLQEVIKEQEEKIQVLSRKVLLESKNYRHHLNVEVIKHKETQKDLTSALSMISKLERELIGKEKQIPGGKVLIKRESKNLMPVILRKPSDMQPKLGVSEDSFLNRGEERMRVQFQDSPEPELELLNCLESSDDTPTPIKDIFPLIHESKKPNLEMKTSTEITFSKSEMLNVNNDLSVKSTNNALKPRKSALAKKNPKISKDPKLNAKALTESISEDMETIENLAQKVQSETLSLENKDDVNFLIQELKASAAKHDVINQLGENTPEKEEDKQDRRRQVPKRKLEEDKETKQLMEKPPDFEFYNELSKMQQEKLENMTKTWNSLKGKIKEERMKAEEKMKELQKFNNLENSLENNLDNNVDNNLDNSSSEEEPYKTETPPIENDFQVEETTELNFTNFTDNTDILQELEKTDKIFRKLKNESKKSGQKISSSTALTSENKSKANLTQKTKPKQPVDIKSFRTESQREPKYLEEFQKEYQKQNLLKALKAIDVGKDPNLSTGESEESDSEPKKENFFQQKTGLKSIKQLPSDSDKGLMAELFGSRHRLDKNENLKIDYGTVASVNE